MKIRGGKVLKPVSETRLVLNSDVSALKTVYFSF